MLTGTPLPSCLSSNFHLLSFFVCACVRMSLSLTHSHAALTTRAALVSLAGKMSSFSFVLSLSSEELAHTHIVFPHQPRLSSLTHVLLYIIDS